MKKIFSVSEIGNLPPLPTFILDGASIHQVDLGTLAVLRDSQEKLNAETLQASLHLHNAHTGKDIYLYAGSTSILLSRDAMTMFTPDQLHKQALRDFLNGVDPQLASELATAAQVLNWDIETRFCGRCGSAQTWHPIEVAKRCESCQENSYPRIQPVVIVLIRRGEELLLAKGLAPRKFYSCVSGFVEVGESLEQTLHREVMEEVGVRVKNLQYFASQPWPFPHNLMLAFIAEWESGDIRIDTNELTDAAWFTKDAAPPLPPAVSVSRRMIDSVWR